jgi:ABC-type nitrate/sulfonate/bicarbonate transport system permease component
MNFMIKHLPKIVFFSLVIAYLVASYNSRIGGFSFVPNVFLILNEIGILDIGIVIRDTLFTFGKTTIAFVISFGICFGVVFLSMIHKGFGRVVLNFSHILKSYPSIAIFPFVTLVFGLGDISQIIVGCLSASALKISSVSQKIHNSSLRLSILNKYSFSHLDRFTKVIVPQIIEFAFDVASSSLSICFVVIIVLELSSSNYSGLGYELNLAKNNLNPQLMWIWLVIIGAVGYLLNYILGQVSKFVVFWK